MPTKLTLEKLDQLDQEFEKFKSNLENTEHQETKDAVAFIDKHRPNKAFQYWALMMLDREQKLEQTQNLAAEFWELQDRINELLGHGAEVIKERDELLGAIKIHAPDWKSKLLWCVEIAEEPDSPFEQIPAENKAIAQRVVKRYQNITTNRFIDHPDLAESINNSIHFCIWHGTDDEFEALKSETFYNEEWFKQPMYNCRSIEEIQEAFRDKDIVHCFKGDEELITDSIEEAKRFYEVA